MNLLKRINELSTRDLRRLQTAVLGEIERRRELAARSAAERESDQMAEVAVIAFPQWNSEQLPRRAA